MASEGPPTIETTLKGLPEALDQAVYVEEKWPLVVDPTGDASRFLKYQRGSFLMTSLPPDMGEDNLRRCLVGGLRYASTMCLKIDSEGFEVDQLFSDLFPEAVMDRQLLYKEDTWKPLLRPEDGDPTPEEFIARDEFRLVMVTENEPLPPKTAELMCIVRVRDASDGRGGGGKDDGEFDAVADAYGVKAVVRNSKEMVEAGFDGDLDEIKSWLEKGYDLESVDAHKHTCLSEAAVKGHDEVVKYLLGLGADPNKVNDKGRSPLYRAAFQGHTGTVELLLQSGADPHLKDTNLEGPFDVTHDDATRALLSEFPAEETERLMRERAETVKKQAEERLKTAAEREAAARAAIRDELVEAATAGDATLVTEILERMVTENMSEGGRPRATAQVRDERGNTLLAVAAWNGHVELCELLLTKWKEFDAVMEEVDIKVWKTNVHARDAKGWTPVSIAAFHGHPKVVKLLLDHGADPGRPNAYHKNAFDFARERAPEVLAVLDEWEATQSADYMKQGSAAGKEADDAKEGDGAGDGGAAAGGDSAGAGTAPAKSAGTKGKGAKAKAKGAKGKGTGKKAKSGAPKTPGAPSAKSKAAAKKKKK